MILQHKMKEIRQSDDNLSLPAYLCYLMKRLFAAIKIHPGEAFLGRYFSLKNKLKNEKIKWVDPENIHITLKFIGETPEHHIPAVVIALRQAAHGFPAYELSLSDTGIFGSSYKPRVIWFGLQDKGETADLAEKILSELENAGFERDRQNFVPHLTVGRIKHLENKKYFQEVIDQHREGFLQKEEVMEFHLFESILRSQGPEYHIIESFKLV